MRSVNFIPARRLAARSRRRRRNRWAVTMSVYALMLVGVYGGAYALWGGGHVALADEERRTTLRIEQSKRDIHTLQEELTAGEATLKANRALTDQPDWSILLALVARDLNDEVVLTRCELKGGASAAPTATAATPMPTTASAPAAVPAASPEGARPEVFVLDVTGYGKTMMAVSQFVLAMERTGLFDEVRLVKTNREPFLTTSAVAFQITCLMESRSGDEP